VETRRKGDEETRGWGDDQTVRKGDRETRRQGDEVNFEWQLGSADFGMLRAENRMLKAVTPFEKNAHKEDEGDFWRKIT
jgi:hypothetical protein